MEEIIRYPMRSKNEGPLFNFIVRKSADFDYYLFESFDSAVEYARKLFALYNRRINIYEYEFTKQREFRTINSFWIDYNGKLRYDKYADIGLHVEFFVNAGTWMNPNQHWINEIHKQWEREDKKKLEEEING